MNDPLSSSGLPGFTNQLLLEEVHSSLHEM